MTDIAVRLLTEVEHRSRRLGRHVEHDERSRAFPAATAALRTVVHKHHGDVLNQGSIGSCTDNAAAQALMCEPLWHKGRKLTESDALNIYETATRLDSIPGTFPPDDTGSSGLAAAKAAKQLGWISSYRHAFGIDHTLGALMNGAVMLGTDWREGMDLPGPDGVVSIAGAVRGGHEYLGFGYDVVTGYVTCLNSWGLGWGVRGVFRIHRTDLAKLLAAGGDCTQLVT